MAIHIMFSKLAFKIITFWVMKFFKSKIQKIVKLKVDEV
jgi:hypothetical protein